MPSVTTELDRSSIATADSSMPSTNQPSARGTIIITATPSAAMMDKGDDDSPAPEPTTARFESNDPSN